MWYAPCLSCSKIRYQYASVTDILAMPQVNLKLSPHDQQVLESVFNPLELSGITSHNVAIQAELELVDKELETEELPASRELELQAVRLTEQGELDKALSIFAQALQLSERASVYNNRAQTLRLAKRDEGKSTNYINRFNRLKATLNFPNSRVLKKYHEWYFLVYHILLDFIQLRVL